MVALLTNNLKVGHQNRNTNYIDCGQQFEISESSILKLDLNLIYIYKT